MDLVGSPQEVMSVSCIGCNNKMVAVGHFDGSITVFDVDLRETLGVCTRHMGPVYDVCCIDDVILSGSSDFTVRIWKLEPGITDVKLDYVYRGHEAMINKILYVSDLYSCRIFTLSFDSIHVWDYTNKKAICDINPAPKSTSSSYFVAGIFAQKSGSKYSRLVCGSSIGICVWDINTYALLRIVETPAFSTSELLVGVGLALYAATDDNGLALIDSMSGEHILTIPIPEFRSSSCGFWLNSINTWLDGSFMTDHPIFYAINKSGDLVSYYLNNC